MFYFFTFTYVFLTNRELSFTTKSVHQITNGHTFKAEKGYKTSLQYQFKIQSITHRVARVF